MVNFLVSWQSSFVALVSFGEWKRTTRRKQNILVVEA